MYNYAILINSCDAYADLWSTFFYLLKKNWPESSKKNIYLNTETTTIISSDLNIKIINTEIKGQDMWGKRFLNSLSKIKEEYVVVIMDDFFIKSPICDRIIQNCINEFEKDKNIAAFYLVNTLKKDTQNSILDNFTEIPIYTNYRLNSAPAIWRKEKLIKYIKEEDNPWAWEYFGTCRTNKESDKFYCVSKIDNPVYDYAHAIYRGKWLEKDIIPLIKQYNLDLDLSKRGLVKNDEPLPKRSLIWKLKFIITGIKMVGFIAIIEIFKDKKNAYTKK